MSNATLLELERPSAPSLNGECVPFVDRLNQSRIPCLDGLRGIAAYLVVTSHIHLFWDPFSIWGAFAVNIFFVLSGFLITHLLIREFEKTGAVSLRNFYIRRTLRVFPAFYVAWVFILLAAILVHRPFGFWEPVASFFYMGDYYHAFRTPGQMTIMVVSWSLAVEEKFYLLWPLVFAYSLGKWTRLFKICLVVFGLVCLNNLILAHWVKPSVDYLSHAFDTQVHAIMLGCALALATRIPAMQELFRKIALRPAWILATVTLLAGPLIAYNLLTVSADLSRYYFAYIVPAQLPLIAVLLVQLITWSEHPLVNWLNSKPMVFLGTLSYGIYLYHNALTGIANHFVRPYVYWKVFESVELLAPLAVAYVSYRLVEKPLLDRKKKFSAVA